MLRHPAGGFIAIGALFATLASVVLAQQQLVVTVKELFASNHQLEVEAGREVAWADPHFERVWFPRGGPSVQPTPDAGLATRFDTPGRYQGVFTATGAAAPETCTP